MRASRWLRLAAWAARPGRTGPLSESWGRERGQEIDRWYIDRFLELHADDVRGDVLELLDDRYTSRFGSALTSTTILDIDAANPRATLVADLGERDSLPPERFDAIVITQTLQFVFDLRATVHNLHRALRAGGVCLATVPVVSRLDRAGLERGEHWRITPVGCGRLFAEAFGTSNVSVVSYGNAKSSAAFLLGIAADDLAERELTDAHPGFPMLAAVRAQRA